MGKTVKVNKDLINLTFSDLLIKYKYEKKDFYLEEAKNRLLYCDFSPNVIDFMIDKELELVENNIIISDHIYISKEFKINDLRKCYKKLMISELMGLIDEAVMVDKYFKNDFSDEVLKEIEEIKEEGMDSFLYKEIFDRIENYFRDANNLKLAFKGYYYGERINTFYENEINIIIMNRWKDDFGLDRHSYEESE